MIILGRIEEAENERILGEFKTGIKDINYTVITNKRVVLAQRGIVGMDAYYRSIPLRSILSVDLKLDKKVLGDVYLNTLNGQVECHVYDSKKATDMYNLIMSLLI